MSQKLLSRNKNGLYKKKGLKIRIPVLNVKIKCKVLTLENLTTDCQSEICVLPVLCNGYQIIS